MTKQSNFYVLKSTGGVWPPIGVETFDVSDLPLMNTLVLLWSGCSVTWAHHALREGDRDGLVKGLAATVLLGLFLQGFKP